MSGITADAAPDVTDIEDLVCDLPGRPRDDDLAFDHPWEIRAFALAVAGHKLGSYDWARFQGALINAIDAWESAHPSGDGSWSYYEHWVTALEQVLADNGSLDLAGLDTRHAEVLATPANRNHHHAVLEPVAIDPAH